MLSVCIIARDEAEMLPGCLASLEALRAALPCEVVLCDTGSVDDTQVIAAAAGARVIEEPWRDDFSAARNAAIDAAEGTLILSLDADERVVSAPEILAACLADSTFIGGAAELRNLDDRGRCQSAVLQYRVFRRHPALRYHYPIHEQIGDRIVSLAQREGGRVHARQPVVTLEHLGYTEAVLQSRGKLSRNLRILEALIARAPEDPFAWYNYGKTRKGIAGASDPEAARAIDQALVLTQSAAGARRPFEADCFLLRALLAETQEGPEAALAWLDRGLARCSGDTELLHARAALRLREPRALDALRDFRRCLDSGAGPRFAFGAGGRSRIRALRGAAEAIAALERCA